MFKNQKLKLSTGISIIKTDLAYLKKNQIEILEMENRRIKIKNKPLWRFNTRLDGPEKRITEYKIEEMIQNVTQKRNLKISEWRNPKGLMYS